MEVATVDARKRNRWDSRWFIEMAGVAMLALFCATGGPGEAEARGPARPKGFLYGPVESALLKPLRQSVPLLPYTGRVDHLKKAALLVLDGDHISPQHLQGDEVVATALRAGMWVLVLDATEDHKKIGLADSVLASTDGDDAAYLAHLTRDEHERPLIHVIGMSLRSVAPHTDGIAADASARRAALKKGKRPDPSTDAARAFVAQIVGHIGRATPPPSPIGVGSEVPPGLLYVTYYFSQLYPEMTDTPYIYTVPSSAGPPDVPQHPTVQANATVTVFLNNRDNPQGDFQFIVSEMDVTTTPKSANENFANWVWEAATPSGDYTELGWFQTKLFTTLTGQAGWVMQPTSPQTANGVDTITSGVSFQIGYNQAQGGSGNFGYSSSTSHTITDWKVTNDSQEPVASWRYRTAYPVDADQADYFCREQDIYSQESCFPERLPNDLSINTLQLHTSSVWQTPTVENGTATIGAQNNHEMVLLYCPQEDVGFYRCGSPKQKIDEFPHAQNYTLNLAAVLPVPITGIAFSANPVKAGTPVVGTVTLARPVLVDTDILLASNVQNATVLPSVTVKAGQASATFQVLTNANGLANCGSVTATIDAFYAEDSQAQLVVNNTCTR